MDIELQAKQLAEEIRHEREMRLLNSDWIGHGFDHTMAGFEAIRVALEQITLVQKQFTVDQAKTDGMLRNLISLIAKQHSNGKD